MDTSLILAIVLFAAPLLYVAFASIKSFRKIKKIKDPNSTINIENWTGNKYTIKSRYKNTRDLISSVDSYLHSK